MKVKALSTILILIGVTAALLWLWGINDPYVGSYNTNNNFLSLAAKNYLRFGFVRLKFFPTYFAGQTLPTPIDYYLHHPMLMFLLATIPFALFGFGNWVVHVVPLFFMVASLYLIYRVGRLVWNKRVGIWATVLAALFPMTSFYWKFIFFEQISLFWMLLIFYFLVRYLKRPEKRHLRLIFLFSFFLMLSDWSGLYLILPLAAFWLSPYRKPIYVVLKWYFLATSLGLVIFLVAVGLLKSGYTDLISAIWGRALNTELTGQSFWPLRLVIISLLRTGLYFTPLAAAGLIYFGRLLNDKKQRFTLPSLILIFFFILGTLNLVFLPTATWGHSYFLFYYIPFFAFSGGLILSRLERRSVLLYALLAIVFWSISLNFLKIAQIKKQLWKYDVAKAVNPVLAPYETIGVINFAGDVFANYFLHPSQPMTLVQVPSWITGDKYNNVRYTLFSCQGDCTAEEFQFIASLPQNAVVTQFEVGQERAWLISRVTEGAQTGQIQSKTLSAREGFLGQDSIFLKVYRRIRDQLSVGQI